MFHMASDSHLFRTREELEAEGFVLQGNVFQHPDSLSLSLSLSEQRSDTSRSTRLR
jgi:hypothetical protein